MEFNNVGKDKINKTNYSLTKDQQKAVDEIISFIANPFDTAKYIIGLTGAGGTGKTFVTNYIITHCKYSPSVIKCVSTTHKACRVFSQAIGNKEVDTIQSTFGFRPDLKLEDFNPFNPQFNPMSKPKLDNVKLLIIDESSMLPAGLVTFICDKCKARNIKIIFIGDAFQLSPVNEKRSIAFNRCYKICELNEIVRQAANNPITNLLKLLRYDIQYGTYRFIEYVSKHISATNYNNLNEGFSICDRQSFINLINNSFTNEEYTKNINMYRIIAYTNDCVSGWNNYIRNKIIRDSNKNIITKNDLIMSYRTIVNEFMESILNNSEEYIINDIVDFVDDTYGFKGFLIKFQMINGGYITKPLFVIDHRDKFTILKYIKILTDLITSAKNAIGSNRISCWKEYYTFKEKYLIAVNIKNKRGKILYTRDIDYGFSITSHKSQGSTYDTVFVDINDIIYDKNGKPYDNFDDILRRLYVACSRARKELILGYGY